MVNLLIQDETDETGDLNEPTTALRAPISGHSKEQPPTLNTVCNLIYTQESVKTIALCSCQLQYTLYTVHCTSVVGKKPFSDRE